MLVGVWGGMLWGFGAPCWLGAWGGMLTVAPGETMGVWGQCQCLHLCGAGGRAMNSSSARFNQLLPIFRSPHHSCIVSPSSAVAEFTLRNFPACALLRRHPVPPPRQFEPLLRAAAAVGASLDPSTSKVRGEGEAEQSVCSPCFAVSSSYPATLASCVPHSHGAQSAQTLMQADAFSKSCTPPCLTRRPWRPAWTAVCGQTTPTSTSSPFSLVRCTVSILTDPGSQPGRLRAGGRPLLQQAHPDHGHTLHDASRLPVQRWVVVGRAGAHWG